MRGAKNTGPLPEAKVPDATLLAQLGSTQRSTQRLACTVLAERLGEHPELREALRSTIREGTPLARFAAAFVLFGAERPTLRLLPALLDALELEDGDIRWQATQMLATLGRLQGEVFPVVVHEARNAPSPLRRRMALYTLRELAPESEESAAATADALDDPIAEVQRAALTCFGKLSGANRDARSRREAPGLAGAPRARPGFADRPGSGVPARVAGAGSASRAFPPRGARRDRKLAR